MTKQLVRRYLYDLSLYSTFDCQTVDEVIANLLEIKQSYPTSKILFDLSYSAYDNETEIKLVEERLETDKEYKERLASEEREKQSKAKAKAKAEEKDRKEYERLKKKFEGV